MVRIFCNFVKRENFYGISIQVASNERKLKKKRTPDNGNVCRANRSAHRIFIPHRNPSVTGGEECHSGGILFQSSTVLDRNKMLPA
jgi:hypothetical protein